MLVNSVLELIGKTPLLKIPDEVTGLKNIALYAKLELYNPFGSLKDRAGWAMLSGQLSALRERRRTVIESSSGNTAKALGAICAMNNIPVRVVTNRIQMKEVKLVLQLLGVDITELPGLSSCPDPNDPSNPVAEIERQMEAEPGAYYHTSQYTNELNTAAHRSATGPEIIADLGDDADYFIAGMGTTGSSRGAGEYLKSVNPSLVNVGVIARKGQVVPGIRNGDEMHEVGLFRRDFYSEIVEVDAGAAIDGVLTLSRKLGVLAGPTSGAVYSAALGYLAAIDPTLSGPRNAVFIVCDRVEWYLSYLQKHRPELFGLAVRKDTPRCMDEEACSVAPRLTVSQARQWLSGDMPCLVVDLRGGIAYKAGHIPGSFNYPADKLDDACEFCPPFPRTHRVILVCPRGEKSRAFAAFLGRHHIPCASLDGGFDAWLRAGGPVEKTSAYSN
jgi:cysteine synthase B